MIERICAWCNAFMGYKRDSLISYERVTGVSHGICRRCYRAEVGDDAWDLWHDVGGEGGGA